MAANLDELDHYYPGCCAMKCNGEIERGNAQDCWCDFMGHWKDCPYYVAGAELLDEKYLRSREPFRDLPGQMKFDFTRGRSADTPKLTTSADASDELGS